MSQILLWAISVAFNRRDPPQPHPLHTHTHRQTHTILAEPCIILVALYLLRTSCWIVLLCLSCVADFLWKCRLLWKNIVSLNLFFLSLKSKVLSQVTSFFYLRNIYLWSTKQSKCRKVSVPMRTLMCHLLFHQCLLMLYFFVCLFLLAAVKYFTYNYGLSFSMTDSLI